jgi:hypothetical protein
MRGSSKKDTLRARSWRRLSVNAGGAISGTIIAMPSRRRTCDRDRVARAGHALVPTSTQHAPVCGGAGVLQVTAG